MHAEGGGRREEKGEPGWGERRATEESGAGFASSWEFPDLSSLPILQELGESHHVQEAFADTTSPTRSPFLIPTFSNYTLSEPFTGTFIILPLCCVS